MSVSFYKADEKTYMSKQGFENEAAISETNGGLGTMQSSVRKTE